MLRKTAAKKATAYLNKVDKDTKAIASAFAVSDGSYDHKSALASLATSEKELKKIYAAVKAIIANKPAMVKASNEGNNGQIETILATISSLATRIDIVASAINSEEYEEEINEDEITIEDVLEDFGGDEGDDLDPEDEGDDLDPEDEGDDLDFDAEDDDLGDDEFEEDQEEVDPVELESKKKTLSKKKTVAKKRISSRASNRASGLFSFVK
jgi:hypothetical protein